MGEDELDREDELTARPPGFARSEENELPEETLDGFNEEELELDATADEEVGIGTPE